MNGSSSLSSSYSNSTRGESQPLYIFTAIFVANFAFGLPANSYALWLSVKQRLQNEIFFFNLALSEMIFCFGSVLVLLQIYLGFEYSKLIMFFGELLQVGRPLFQCCICVERYVAVVHPIIFLKYKALRYKLVATAVVWVLILSNIIVFMLTNDAYLNYYLLLGLYVVIFPLKIFCCLMVLRVLKQPGPSERKKDMKGIQKSKVKAFKIIFMVLISSLLTYIPTVASLALINILDVDKFKIAWRISLYIVIIAGFLQPLIYVHNSAPFPFCKSL